ncbi:hypothetical protein L1F30_15040 [Simiduia sp. 21SJ11W-1]|uniref:hypothetical protein n=1 Tax=Simiduia sp. 21SJ11W-1 TaxID=2909669 RepID=UPI00209FAEBF|nr:hypothetical protein [Simiduia sp. 21SJ11W-1]UTA47463.1 hypothetical protein L1F30_15040 [Simiduia sp. 21SJ11W-1]
MENTEEKSLFIWLLEFGEKHQGGTTLHSAINGAIEDKLLSSRSQAEANTISNLFKECFDVPEWYKNQEKFNDSAVYSLKSEYYFRLLEYRELQLAREAANRAEDNARFARKHASWSIGLSVIAVIAAVVTPFFIAGWQSKQPIALNQDSITKIVLPLLEANRARIPATQEKELAPHENTGTATSAEGAAQALEGAQKNESSQNEYGSPNEEPKGKTSNTEHEANKGRTANFNDTNAPAFSESSASEGSL